MKVEILNKKVFQPIDLKITIESKKELFDLYVRMAAGSDQINIDGETRATNGNWELYDELKQIIESE